MSPTACTAPVSSPTALSQPTYTSVSIQVARLRLALCTRCWSWLLAPVTSTPLASCPHPDSRGDTQDAWFHVHPTSTLPAIGGAGQCSRRWVPLTTHHNRLAVRVWSHVAWENEFRSKLFYRWIATVVNILSSTWRDFSNLWMLLFTRYLSDFPDWAQISSEVISDRDSTPHPPSP